MAIAIAIKPVGPSDDSAQPSEAGAAIAEAAKQLSTDDLTTLMHGISTEALEVMEKIPDLAPFADFIENGSQSTQEEPDDQAAPAAGPPGSARASVASALQQNGVR